MPFWIVIALFVSSFVLSALLVKGQRQKPAALEEFQFPQAEEGTPQSVVFGEVWTPGWQVLWYGNLRTMKIKSKKK